MILVEGVAFAVGVLMLAVSTYLMAIEAIRTRSGHHKVSPQAQ